MDKLISAESLLLSVRDDPEINSKHFARFKEHINHAPDAVKHGRWVDVALRFTQVKEKCSICGGIVYAHGFNYCPNCGARMDGDGNA